MVRIVLDTNVIVSGFLSDRGTARALLELGRGGSINFVTSRVLLDELEEVLGRFMTPAAALEIRTAVEEIAFVAEPTSVPAVTRDPDDDHVLAAAIKAEASYIVTRDHHLLIVEEYERIAILEHSPALHKIRSELEGAGR